MKKKTVFSLIMVVALIFSILPAINANAATTWNLAWSDEFNGSTINKANWISETGTGSGGWGNNELEYYTNRPENVRTENGNLLIEARKEAYGGMGYTSGRIKTQGLKDFKYGKIEARMKVPSGQGIWPAFWMLGSNISQVVWPKCGEIDIMEHVNNEPNIHGTIHWNDNDNKYANYGGSSGNLDVTQYHVYSIEWDASSIKWFIDGAKYWEANILNSVNGTDEFHKPFFILFNLAVGGNWPGNPDQSTQFPAKMYVDYIRVYQQGSGDNTGTNLPSTTWYLSNQAVTGVGTTSQNMQTTKSGISGWQPVKTINQAPSLWMTPLVNGTYPSGKWNFTLWTNNPGSNSNITVDILKVNPDGTGAALLGTQTMNVSATGTGNHPTVYSYNLNAASLNNQRLMVKVYKSSGVDATTCYNTNDFPTRLVTP